MIYYHYHTSSYIFLVFLLYPILIYIYNSYASWIAFILLCLHIILPSSSIFLFLFFFFFFLLLLLFLFLLLLPSSSYGSSCSGSGWRWCWCCKFDAVAAYKAPMAAYGPMTSVKAATINLSSKWLHCGELARHSHHLHPWCQRPVIPNEGVSASNREAT